MADADGDALGIEDRADVMRMGGGVMIGKDRGLARSAAEDADAVDLLQFRGRVDEELVLVGAAAVQSMPSR